jgi:single-stranded DNA-specific DHH superfamily exonuclease
MAAGLSLSVEQVPAFTDCFLQALREAHPQGLPEPTLELSCWIELEDLSVEFLQQLERLAALWASESRALIWYQICRA